MVLLSAARILARQPLTTVLTTVLTNGSANISASATTTAQKTALITLLTTHLTNIHDILPLSTNVVAATVQTIATVTTFPVSSYLSYPCPKTPLV